MAPKYIPKTAITTPFGNFKFNYSCFSLRNTGAMFQTLMDSILSNLPFCMVYIDDILISALQEEHIRQICEVLQHLQNHGLILQPAKGLFGCPSIKFLGHTITSARVNPLSSKVNTICHFLKPQSIKSLQEFIGMLTFYH